MAATTAIAGYDGSITGPSGMTEVISWNCDITVDELDATSMASSGWKEFIEGLKSVTVSANVQGSAAPTTGMSACTLKTKATDGSSFTSSAHLHRVGIGVPVDGKVTYDVELNFTGSVAIA